MKLNSLKLFTLILMTTLTGALTGATARAAAKGPDHLISTGAGIAAPSDTSALLENPAGFVYNDQVKLLFTGTASDSSNVPESVGAGVFLGNGTIGGGLKFDYYDSHHSALTAGIAAEIKQINTAFGIACGAALGSTVSVDCSHFGLIYGPQSQLRIGATLFTSGPTAVGAGVAYDATQEITLALDGSVHTSGNGTAAKPGVLLKLSPVQLALGYGFNSDGGTGMINSGVSVGLGVEFAKRFALQAYYNQLAKYFVGLSIEL